MSISSVDNYSGQLLPIKSKSYFEEVQVLADKLSRLNAAHESNILEFFSSSRGLEGITEKIDELNDRFDDLEIEISEGSQSSKKNLEILKSIRSLLESVISELKDWDETASEKVEMLNENIARSDMEVQQLAEVLKSLGGSPPPSKNIDPTHLDDDQFNKILLQLESLQVEVEQSIHKLESSQPIQLPTNWSRDVKRAVDDGINELDSKYQAAIQKLAAAQRDLQTQVKEMQVELDKITKISVLKNNIFEKKAAEAIEHIKEMSCEQIIQAVSEAYRFELLETVIEIIKGVKKNNASVSKELSTTLTNLENSEYWSTDKAPKDSSKTDSKQKKKTLSSPVIELNESNSGQDAYHYDLCADIVKLTSHKQPGKNLKIRARKLILMAPSACIDLSGDRPASDKPQAAKGTAKSTTGAKGGTGNPGMNSGSIDLMVGVIVDQKDTPTKLQVKLNGGKGGKGQKSGDGYTPPNPADKADPKIPSGDSPSKFHGGGNPVKLRGGSEFQDTWYGLAGAKGDDAPNGGDAYKTGGLGGDPGNLGKHTFVAIDEKQIVVSATIGARGDQGDGGTPGKSVSGGFGGYFYYINFPAAFSGKTTGWHRGDKIYVTRYMSQNPKILQAISKSQPNFVSGNALKERADRGKSGSAGKLI